MVEEQLAHERKRELRHGMAGRQKQGTTIYPIFPSFLKKAVES